MAQRLTTFSKFLVSLLVMAFFLFGAFMLQREVRMLDPSYDKLDCDQSMIVRQESVEGKIIPSYIDIKPGKKGKYILTRNCD